MRVAGDEDVWLMPADFADNVTAEVKAWDEVAIRQVQKERRVRSDQLGGVGLFRMSDPAQTFWGHFGMGGGVESFIAAGQKNVGDAVPGACPACQSPAAKKFRVVWVGEDDQNILRGCPGICHGSDTEHATRDLESMVRVPYGY